mmetsp:Transcript_4202/g.8182  ORF Transcript_4202/g.8182 Transcript_4202/m.8182 type:complete len:106 (-) Transcript_4202:599-916(-)
MKLMRSCETIPSVRRGVLDVLRRSKYKAFLQRNILRLCDPAFFFLCFRCFLLQFPGLLGEFLCNFLLLACCNFGEKLLRHLHLFDRASIARPFVFKLSDGDVELL